jgi:hypothetical protein
MENKTIQQEWERRISEFKVSGQAQVKRVRRT